MKVAQYIEFRYIMQFLAHGTWMKAQEFIDRLRADGRYSFTIQEAQEAFGLSKIPTLNALHRLKQGQQVVSPARGLYLIVPPEYQAFGCLPADMFVSDLMKYLNQPYYVGFLSAAQFYGAAHQKPQQFQIVTSKYHRPLQCGRVRIVFIINRNVTAMPTKLFNTTTGTIAVATPEVIAADLVSAPQHGAGINNVATVLLELIESMDAQRLIELISLCPEISWVQRLGYLLEFLGFEKLADDLAEALKDKKLHWIRLVYQASYKKLSRNSRWKIIINTEVEPDVSI